MRYFFLPLLFLATACEPLCGNGDVEPGESCDDGNNNSDDVCSSLCAIEFCGDGIKQANELCDDGNDDDQDGCSVFCVTSTCGDGLLEGPEDCDDGNLISDDGCSDACFIELCGDGVINGTEECDNGNFSSNDGCTADCQLEFCGDGIIQDGLGEVCEDGNLVSGDGCRGDCLGLEVCGDGLVDTIRGERCDDGNTLDNDGCEGDCSLICGSTTDAIRASLDPATGHCYLGFEGVLQWADAESRCEGLGGYLTTIDSEEENSLARAAGGDIVGPWLGFHDLNSEAQSDALGFEKITGGLNTFSKFASGQPNNAFGVSTAGQDCLQFAPLLEQLPNEWSDLECPNNNPNATSFGYICELTPSPCGDGVVQVSQGEECDDSNTQNGDGCSATCTTEVCGSGEGASGFALDANTGHCYLSFREELPWLQAEQRCEGVGGYLAVLSSAAERALARGATQPFEGPWLGLNDLSGDAVLDPNLYLAITGETLGVTFFGEGEPSNDSGTNNDCVHFLRADLFFDPAGWGDLACDNTTTTFLCEVEPSPCGDGVVQGVLGETCDDGNVANNDGCSAACLSE